MSCWASCRPFSTRWQARAQRFSTAGGHGSIGPGSQRAPRTSPAIWRFANHDLRPLQSALMVLGLSSLGRAEGRVLVNLNATLAGLASVAGAQVPARPDEAAFFRRNALLAAARDELFGSSVGQRQVRILVTCPSEAADDETFFSRIALAGADAVRINCARDDADAETDRRLRVLVDLAGPKIRTEQVRHPSDRKRLAAGDRLLLCRTTLVDRPDAPAFQATTRCRSCLSSWPLGSGSTWTTAGLGARLSR